MKSIALLFLAFLAFNSSFAQESIKVNITFTYKGTPMCYWDVTIKQGDVTIGTAKTDENGKADFGYCRLAYNGVDAYGYKKTANGDKKWDVKGYIGIPEDGKGSFDFQALVEEMGMGGMLESAWGLTLNDCAGSSGSSSSSSSSSSPTSDASTTEPSSSDEMKKDNDEWEKEQEAKRAEQKAQQDQFQEDWASGKSQAEGLQNSKQMHENKVATLSAKIDKKKAEQAKLKAGSKEYSEVSYEIRDLELDKALTEIKLEKTNLMIANSNQPISKAEKLKLEAKEEPLKAEQDSLKDAQKNGAMYGSTAAIPTVSETKSTEKEVVEEKPHSNNPRNNEEEEEDVLKLYTPEEIAALSVMNIKKLKLDYGSKITNRKLGLKTKSSLWKPEKIEKVKQEIVDLEKQTELFEAELAKRKEAEE